MMDAPDVTQLPGAPSVSKPASGSYGDQASSDKLKAALGMNSPQQPTPPPSMSPLPGGAKPMPSQGPFGLPAAITNPSSQPDVPVSTPLATPVNPVANAGAANQKRLALLDMLARNPDVSDETRELAEVMLARLTG